VRQPTALWRRPSYSRRRCAAWLSPKSWIHPSTRSRTQHRACPKVSCLDPFCHHNLVISTIAQTTHNLALVINRSTKIYLILELDAQVLPRAFFCRQFINHVYYFTLEKLLDPRGLRMTPPPDLQISSARPPDLLHQASRSPPPGLQISFTRPPDLLRQASKSPPPGLHISSTRPPDLSSTSCDLDLWPFASELLWHNVPARFC